MSLVFGNAKEDRKSFACFTSSSYSDCFLDAFRDAFRDAFLELFLELFFDFGGLDDPLEDGFDDLASLFFLPSLSSSCFDGGS